MSTAAKYVHTSIVADDWQSLARFYAKVFGCSFKPPRRRLSGHWLDELTSLKGARIRGAHLLLPGHGSDGPTLEIFQYSRTARRHPARINRPGLAHIAFAVPDVHAALAAVEEHGGDRVGGVVEADIRGAGRICVAYAKDPEGNIIELQRWQ